MSRLLYTSFEASSHLPGVKLYFLEGKYICVDIMTEAFGTKSDAKKEQIEEFIRHKQEALGCKRLKAISAAKGSFVLKHTTAVNCQVPE